MPTETGRACFTEAQKASMLWPDRVRPAFCDTVTEIISGSRRPISPKSLSSAKMAALALSVSKTVSSSRMSAPPSTKPAAWS